jgi:hypothetical protein
MAFCEPACIDQGQGRIPAVRIAGEMGDEEVQKVLGRLFVLRAPCSVLRAPCSVFRVRICNGQG